MRNAIPSPAITAGPWHIDRQSPYSQISIKPYPGRIVCDINGTDAEAEANARLIAAAPELLAALKMSALVMAEKDYSNTPSAGRIFEQCVDAISKATQSQYE